MLNIKLHKWLRYPITILNFIDAKTISNSPLQKSRNHINESVQDIHKKSMNVPDKKLSW